MHALISSRKGRFVAALATAALAALLGVSTASATVTTTNLVANGGFTANAAGFDNYPYYVGGTGNNPPNPPSITDWTSVNGSSAVPAKFGTGVNFAPASISGTAPFGPGSFVFAFLQGAGTSIYQDVSGLTVGQTYSVSYLAAGENHQGLTGTNDNLEQLTASITNGSQVDGSLVSTDSLSTSTMNNIWFTQQLFGFTASAPTETLTFLNSSPASIDSAVDVSSVVIDPIGSAPGPVSVPEPASGLLLLPACAGALLLRNRRRLRRA